MMSICMPLNKRINTQKTAKVWFGLLVYKHRINADSELSQEKNRLPLSRLSQNTEGFPFVH